MSRPDSVGVLAGAHVDVADLPREPAAARRARIQKRWETEWRTLSTATTSRPRKKP